METSNRIDDFVKHGTYLRNWSSRTARLYRDVLATLPESSPTKDSLDRWLVGMRERGLVATTCNIRIRATNSFLSWLHDEQHIAFRLRLKQLPVHAKIPQIPDDSDLKLLARFHTTTRNQIRARAFGLLLADTGLRASEALELTWTDVDLDGLLLTIRGKGGKWRHVPISQAGRKAIWPLRQKPPHRVFEPLAYRNAYRDLKVVCSYAGFHGPHVRPHAFRHYFAVGYIRNGGDIYRLSRILGHSSIATTQIYLRSLAVEAVQEAHAQFSPLARL